MVGERAEAVGVLALVDVPVAERARVVVAAAEPAVVEDEALDADRRGGVGEPLQLGDVVVEVDRLPRVEQHLARRARVAGARAHVARGTAATRR